MVVLDNYRSRIFIYFKRRFRLIYVNLFCEDYKFLDNFLYFSNLFFVKYKINFGKIFY